MYPTIEEVERATEWLDCLMLRSDISIGEDGRNHIVILRKVIGEWEHIPKIEQKIKDECRGGINISMHSEIERLKGELKEARGFCLKTDEVMVAFLQKYLKMPDATFEELCRKCKELTATPTLPQGRITKDMLEEVILEWVNKNRDFMMTSELWSKCLSVTIYDRLNKEEGGR